MITSDRARSAVRAMVAGAVLTAAATVAPFFARPTLADHIRAGYPQYTQGHIDSAVTAYLMILAGVGVLGLEGWFATIWAVRRGLSWARWVAGAMFAAGLSVALTGLLVKDTSGDVGLAPLWGWIGIAPCVAGAIAVTRLWRPGGR